jgi:hypothetical protein
VPATSTRLFQFWGIEDYGGLYHNFYGSDGTCDPGGYGISDMENINFELSLDDQSNGVESYHMYGGCTWADLCTETDSRANVRPSLASTSRT